MGRKSGINWDVILLPYVGNRCEKMAGFVEEFPSLTAMQIAIEIRIGKTIALSTISRGYTRLGIERGNRKTKKIPSYLGPKRYEVSPPIRFNYRKMLESFLERYPTVAKEIAEYNRKKILEYEEVIRHGSTVIK